MPERAADNPSAGAAPDPKGEGAASPGLSVWEHFSLGTVHAAVSLIHAVGSVRGLYGFGRAFGFVEYLINHKRRRKFAAAMRRICGSDVSSARVRAETRTYFMNTRCDKLFYLALDRLGIEDAKAQIHIVGRAHLDAAVAQGRGVYLAFSHHGPHHIIAVLFALLGYRGALVRDAKEGALRRYVQHRLHRKYPELTERSRIVLAAIYPREIYRLLADGFILGSALDIGRIRDSRNKTLMVRMFGEDRPVLTGPLRIAIKTKVPVLQTMISPRAGGGYEMEFMSPLIDPDAEGDRDEALARGLQLYAERVEQYVRRRPHLVSNI